MIRENSIAILCRGHSERHALVSGLTMHLPQFAPAEEGASDRLCISTLAADGLSAECVLQIDGLQYTARAQWDAVRHGTVFPTDCELEIRRRNRWLVGMSLYNAICAYKGDTSPWGALSGVRPAKVAASILRRGLDADQTQRMLCDCYLLSPDKARICTEAALEEMRLSAMLSPADACLYVGIPFCPSVCHYCSFVSRRATTDALHDYCEGLYCEIDALGEGLSTAGYFVRSLYVGGGTPTVLSASALGQLMARIKKSVDLSDCREITVEAGRPDTICNEKLLALRSAGVTRICINPQTLNDAVLTGIGRRHTAEDFRRAFTMARDSASWEINCDLIAGLPGESTESFLRGISEIISLAPEQITVHSLALKNASRMTEEGQHLSTRLREMLQGGETLLRAAGYRPYYIYRQKYAEGGENVGWMKADCVNAYNILMMEEMCSVFAAGAGGISKVLRRGGLDRISNPKYPEEYMARIADIANTKRQLPQPYTGE